MKRIVILGSTGSIGTNTLDIISKFPEKFQAVGLTAGNNVDKLEEQVRTFSPAVVAMADPAAAQRLRARCKGLKTTILNGTDGLMQAATLPDAAHAISAIVARPGHVPTLAAITAGKFVALANKEPMVMAGRLMQEEARKRGIRIFPVDSEHSALFQSMEGHRVEDIRRLILTASGGPLWNLTKEQLRDVTVEQALKHPNWKMGDKITIDSATLMNKGLEVVEARWLFDIPASKIEVVVHRESIIHSLVEYADRSVIAQLGLPDMRTPIAYAMNYPERVPLDLPSLNLAQIGTLTFFNPDHDRFPCLAVGYEVGRVARVSVHGFGHFWVARRCGVKVLKFAIGFGAKLPGRQVGETEYVISAIQLGGHVKMLGEDLGDEVSEVEKQRSFAHASLLRRTAIVAAGPIFNLLLAYLIFTAWLATGAPLFVPSFADLASTVEAVVPGSPAEAAGLRKGDKIVQIGDKRIATWNEMTDIVKRNPGTLLPLVVERDGRTETLTITPAARKERLADGTEIEIGQIGITKANRAILRSEHVLMAPVDGVEATWGWTKLTVVGIAKMLTREISTDNIGGPLTIAKISGDAATQGFSNYVFLIAILSINLGVLNLLPIPVLDGGHLAFFAIEAVKRRPLSIRSRELAQQVGIFLLICLMLYAFRNDILNLWPR